MKYQTSNREGEVGEIQMLGALSPLPVSGDEEVGTQYMQQDVGGAKGDVNVCRCRVVFAVGAHWCVVVG